MYFLNVLSSSTAEETDPPLRKRLRSHSRTKSLDNTTEPPSLHVPNCDSNGTLHTLKVRKTGSNVWKIVPTTAASKRKLKTQSKSSRAKLECKHERTTSLPNLSRRKTRFKNVPRRILPRRNSSSFGAMSRPISTDPLPTTSRSKDLKLTNLTPESQKFPKTLKAPKNTSTSITSKWGNSSGNSPLHSVKPLKPSPAKPKEEPVTYFTTLFSPDSRVTRSRAKTMDVQTVKVSPEYVNPRNKLVGARARKPDYPKPVDLGVNHRQTLGSPSYSSDLLSPTNSSKVDISIECRTRKSLGEFGLPGMESGNGKRDPVLTSNNVVVALTFTDDCESENMIKTGTSVKSDAQNLILHPPRMDRVASITIETGHHDDQKKAAVEISIRPDLLNTLHGYGGSPAPGVDQETE